MLIVVIVVIGVYTNNPVAGETRIYGDCYASWGQGYG